MSCPLVRGVLPSPFHASTVFDAIPYTAKLDLSLFGTFGIVEATETPAVHGN